MSAGFLPARQWVGERMDDPDLDRESLAGAFAGLACLNRFSCSARLIWAPLVAMARREGLAQLSVLDVATGGGDVPIALLRRARGCGIDLRVTAIDRSATALEFAARQARRAGVPIDLRPGDAVQDPLPEGYDAVVCSLFLHHLTDAQAPALLRAMAKSARRLVVASDLVRSSGGYAVAWAATRMLTRSPVVRVDGPLSVRAALTLAEARTMARDAGLAGAVVRRRFPFRFVLTWMPTRHSAAS